jgi:rare lipoprotein A
MKKLHIIFMITAILVGCGSQTTKPTVNVPKENGSISTQPSDSSDKNANETKPTDISDNSEKSGVKSGGYYLDDGPESNPPTNLDSVPDAIPKVEPINPRSTKPYVALGGTYQPMQGFKEFKQSGVASWYGKRFHGKKTASGELYDMYAMSAAHTTLPIPSYVKVTNPKNQRSVIVRVNDRGPFKHSRIIDLSYAAAYKLDIIKSGSAPVTIETINPKTYQTENKSSVALAEKKTKPDSDFFVQVGAFKVFDNAQNLKQKIMNLGITEKDYINHVYNSDLYRLRLGPYNKNTANQIASSILEKLNITSIINNQ